MEYSLALMLEDDGDLPLYQQIYEQIRDGILSGRVRSHQKLPASRQLAKSLGVSRSTVIQSYDQLISEGYLQTKKGAGTFVCTQIPDALLATEPPVTNSAAPSKAATTTLQHLPRGSAYATRLQNVTLPTSANDCTFSFRYWQPDVSLFPARQWQRLVNRHSSTTPDWMGYSTEPMGYLPLREEIAHYIRQVRAVQCDAAQILITQGTQQAVSLISQMLLTAEDGIAVEDPGYLSARKIFRSYGAKLLPIAVDDQGLRVAGKQGLEAQSAGRSVRMVYVTPSHQFPTGALMSLP
ncbi:MAG: PLP-dependent aminotransferase family protein, partial [Cyanobacteria bacterium J06632_3]